MLFRSGLFAMVPPETVKLYADDPDSPVTSIQQESERANRNAFAGAAGGTVPWTNIEKTPNRSSMGRTSRSGGTGRGLHPVSRDVRVSAFPSRSFMSPATRLKRHALAAGSRHSRSRQSFGTNWSSKGCRPETSSRRSWFPGSSESKPAARPIDPKRISPLSSSTSNRYSPFPRVLAVQTRTPARIPDTCPWESLHVLPSGPEFEAHLCRRTSP